MPAKKSKLTLAYKKKKRESSPPPPPPPPPPEEEEEEHSPTPPPPPPEEEKPPATAADAKRRCKSMAAPPAVAHTLPPPLSPPNDDSGGRKAVATPGSARKREKGRRHSLVRPTELPEIDLERIRKILLAPSSSPPPKQPKEEEAAAAAAATAEPSPKRQKGDTSDDDVFGRIGDAARRGLSDSCSDDAAVRRCCRTSLARFQRQLFYEWTSMTTGRASLQLQQQQLQLRAAAAERAKAELQLREELADELRRWEALVARYALPVPLAESPLLAPHRSQQQQQLPPPTSVLAMPTVAAKPTAAAQVPENKEGQTALRMAVDALDRAAPVVQAALQRMEAAEHELPRIVATARDTAISRLLAGLVPASAELPPLVPVVAQPTTQQTQ